MGRIAADVEKGNNSSLSSPEPLYKILFFKNVDKYGKIPSRIIGQVWDSMAHTDRIVVAIPFALFPTNKPMRSVITGMFWFHINFYKGMWAHYLDALDNFRGHLARAPALIFASKIDPIGIPSLAEELKEKWEANGVDVT